MGTKRIGKRAAKEILSEMSEGDLRLLLETASSLVGQKNNRLIDFTDITISSGDFPPGLVQEMAKTLAEYYRTRRRWLRTLFSMSWAPR